MTHVVVQPTFSIQLALFDVDGLVTLVCDVCHGHTMVDYEALCAWTPDYVGCAECGAVNALPDKEML